LGRCPFCGCGRGFKYPETWKFRFYGVFNHYPGTSPRGKRSEFVIRIRPRIMKARSM
jgi:hypothetical protein